VWITVDTHGRSGTLLRIRELLWGKSADDSCRFEACGNVVVVAQVGGNDLRGRCSETR
jgi:hypothetical protein